MIYIITVISLLALGAVAAMLYLYHNKGAEKVEAPVIPDAECCGQHEVCEKESLLSAVSKGVEYYDDEDLEALPHEPPFGPCHDGHPLPRGRGPGDPPLRLLRRL